MPSHNKLKKEINQSKNSGLNTKLRKILIAESYLLSVRANNGLSTLLDNLKLNPKDLAYYKTLDGILTLPNIGKKSGEELHDYVIRLTANFTDVALISEQNVDSPVFPIDNFINFLKIKRQILSVRANNGLTKLIDDLKVYPSKISQYTKVEGMMTIKNVGKNSAKELVIYYNSILEDLLSAKSNGILEEKLVLISLESDLGLAQQSIEKILSKCKVVNIEDIDQLKFTIECIKCILSDRDTSIIKYLFYDGSSLAEIASHLSVTRERVRQLIIQLYTYISLKAKSILDTLKSHGYYLDNTQYNMICISNKDFVEYEELAFPLSLTASIVASWNDLIIYDIRKREGNYFYYSKSFVEIDFKNILNRVDSLFPKRVGNDKIITIRSLVPKSLLDSSLVNWKELVITVKKYINSYKKGIVSGESICVHRTSKKKKYEYIVEILEKKGIPMLVDDIAIQMNEIEGLKKSTGLTIRSNILNHPEYFINTEWSTYGLKKWEDEGKMVGGTIKQIIEKYLLQFDKPKHVSEIAEYVCKHRDTNQASVWGNICLDPKEIFVTYASSFVGLSSKKYRFSDTSFNKLSNKWFKRMTEVYFTGDVCHSTIGELVDNLASDLNVKPVQIRSVINERLVNGDLRKTPVGGLALGLSRQQK